LEIDLIILTSLKPVYWLTFFRVSKLWQFVECSTQCRQLYTRETTVLTTMLCHNECQLQHTAHSPQMTQCCLSLSLSIKNVTNFTRLCSDTWKGWNRHFYKFTGDCWSERNLTVSQHLAKLKVGVQWRSTFTMRHIPTAWYMQHIPIACYMLLPRVPSKQMKGLRCCLAQRHIIRWATNRLLKAAMSSSHISSSALIQSTDNIINTCIQCRATAFSSQLITSGNWSISGVSGKG